MMTYHVQFLLLVVAGWVNRQQQDVIDYQCFDIRSRLGGHLHGDDPPAQDDCKAHGPWPGRKHRH